MTGTFENELAAWGPEALKTRSATLAQAEMYCQTLGKSHYENFPLVSCLLPRSLHQHFFNVYAYCRWADDLGDEIADTDQSLQLLGWWREQLALCYTGSTRHPVFVALQSTISEFDIPIGPFEDLISAFEQDQRVNEYESFADLLDYCRCSANPVGRLVLYLCRCHNEQNVAWSDSICTGLQLANFWQDVDRDWQMGRLYLPAEDRERFGYTRDALESRSTNAEFLELMRFEVDRARALLLAGRPLTGVLPNRLQIDIDLFLRGGLRILERIERIGYRVWERRPVVTKTDACVLLIRACGRFALRRLGYPDPQPPQPKPAIDGWKTA